MHISWNKAIMQGLLRRLGKQAGFDTHLSSSSWGEAALASVPPFVAKLCGPLGLRGTACNAQGLCSIEKRPQSHSC